MGEGGGILDAGNQRRALRVMKLVLYSHFEITDFPKYFVKASKHNKILYRPFRYIN
jgi:hypothetical protein